MVKLQQLLGFKYRKKETVRDFMNRFVRKMAENDDDVKSTTGSHHYLPTAV